MDWDTERLDSRKRYLERTAPRLLREEEKYAEHLQSELDNNTSLTETERRQMEQQIQMVSDVQRLNKGLEANRSTMDAGSRQDDSRDDVFHKKNEYQRTRYAFDQRKYAAAGILGKGDAALAPNTDVIQRMLDAQPTSESEESDSHSAQTAPKITAHEAKRRAMLEFRHNLPIYGYRQTIMDILAKDKLLVLIGDTGSGKSTQIPQFMLEDGYATRGSRRIVCTQPRRVAAMSLASRVAAEVGVALGGTVGYKVRFDERVSLHTELVYMTDGMLLREYAGDPMLSSISAVIIDEAHERGVHTDVLLGLLRETFQSRLGSADPLRLVVASATLHASAFTRYMGDAELLHVRGRVFPISVFYAQKTPGDHVQAAAETAVRLHLTEPLGDVLVFLTGQEEIEACEREIRSRLEGVQHIVREAIVLPLYASLPSAQQKRIFHPTPENARKIVLCTNIAETSLTIDGIVYVVDCGFCKMNWYDPATDTERLIVVPISRAAAEQRKGRCGRTQPGKCYRLYTKATLQSMQPVVVPEIQRTNIAHIVLELKALGIENFLDFQWLDAPQERFVVQAFSSLYSLRAIGADGELTPDGEQMAAFPLDPKLAKCLVRSAALGCARQMATIAALFSVSEANLFVTPHGEFLRRQARQVHEEYRSMADDVRVLLHVFDSWAAAGHTEEWASTHFISYRVLQRAFHVRNQLLLLLDKAGMGIESVNEMGPIARALISGYYNNIAKLSPFGTSYARLKQSGEIHVHPSSALRKKRDPPKLVLFSELRTTSKDFMMHCMGVQAEWVVEELPHLFTKADFV